MAEDSGGSGMTASNGMMAGIDGTSTILTALGNRRHERKMAQDNRAWDYRMWNENNEYNSPAQQRARLLAGGYNPQLALGSPVASGMVHSSPRNAVPIPDTKLMQSMYGMAVQKKGLELTDAQIDATRASAQLSRASANDKIMAEALKNFDYTQKSALSNLTIDQAHQTYDFQKTSNEKLRKEIELMPAQFQLQAKESAARIKSMQSSMSKTELENAIMAEKRKWMVGGMSSSEAAQLATSLIKLFIP